MQQLSRGLAQLGPRALASYQIVERPKIRPAAAPSGKQQESVRVTPPASTVPEAKIAALTPLVPPALASPTDFQAATLRTAEGLSILIAITCQVAACSLYLQSIHSAATATACQTSSSKHQQQQHRGLQQLAAEAGTASLPPAAIFAGQASILALILAWLCGLLARRRFHQR